MSDPTPEPVRKSSLPCTPSPEWEFHTWFPHPDGGGDMVPGERQRGVVVRRCISYGDWEPVRPERWADEPAGAASAVVAVAAPPTGQTALRDRIAEALAAVDGWTWTPDFDRTLSPVWQGYLKRADAVMPVMPSPADRAAVLLEAADRLWALANRTTERGAGVLWAADLLRRLADEAQQQPETPGCLDPIECSHEAALGQAQEQVRRVRDVCDRLRRASVLADGEPHGDRERGVVQAVTRVLAALDEPAAPAEEA